MIQKDKEMVLQDICARLLYRPHIRIYNHWTDSFEDEVLTIDNIGAILRDFPIEDIKPYLRSMSNMTNEERGRYMEFIEWSHNDYDGTTTTCINKEQLHEYLDFIYSHHLDSLGLIRMGIALEAPEGMYYSTEK